MSVFAYLAPEIPALSATFVYEEILGLERLGHQIVPFSVRRPASLAKDQNSLLQRVIFLYEFGVFNNFLYGVLHLPIWGRGSVKAFNWLVRDMLQCGIFKADAWKLAYQFLVAVRLAIFLKVMKCEHLHVHFAHVPAQIAMYASAMANIPFTVMAHANDIFERGILLREKSERAVKLLTISEFNRNYLQNLGIAEERLGVVRCGVSFPLRTLNSPSAIKPVYRIGTLGRLVEKKGIDVLIRAIKILHEGPNKACLSIAGDGPLRQELVQLVQELQLEESVEFVGSVSHSEVILWLQGLDVFVLACKRDKNGDMDGIPVSLMEAMSQSISVVSTRLTGIPELVIHEETGLLAAPEDARDLAGQIGRLLQFPELRDRLVVRAVGHVEREFGKDVNLERLIAVFHEE